MTITLSNTRDEVEVLDKTLTDSVSRECVLVNTDVLNPILKLESVVIDKNYVYIPTFKRYYFVRTVETINGMHTLLHCSVDVLMSYKNEIMELDAYISRNEFDANFLLNDSSMPLLAEKKLVVKGFGNDMISFSEYLLECV